LWPLQVLNLGITDPTRASKFVFDTREPEDMVAFSQAVPILVDMGMNISQQWAHERTGIPQAAEGETVLRPAGQAPATQSEDSAKVVSLAALTALPGAEQLPDQFPDQTALDAAVDDLAPAQLQAQAVAMLQPVIDAIGSAKPDVEVLGLLAEVYPAMDSSGLEEMLTRLLFAAEVWGRLSVEAER
jgi:phage gp29-like protein